MVASLTALVIEDTRMYQQLIEAVFKDLGIDADFVETGEEGLLALSQRDYQLICLDLHLPGISGLELCRQVRQQEQYLYQPIILMTGEEDEKTLIEAFESGVTEVLRKSNIEHLHESIRQIVDSMRNVTDGHVLYIEDSPTSAQLTIHALDSIGLETDHFSSAEKALEAFNNRDYDIIVTDIVVEGAISGFGLVRAVRALPDNRSKVPILAVSGMGDAARRIEILRHGANDYIEKPIINEEFHARVRNLIISKKLFDQVQLQKQQLRNMAITDQLTKLYNRHYLNEAATQAISNAKRYNQPLGLLVIDLDHFKLINDEYGHDRGDTVLNEVGALLKESIREGDIAARFGGEEFVILLPHCSGKDLQDKADRLRLQLAELKPAGLRVTASIGAAVLENDMNFKTLFKQADTAVYAAKEGGRNRVVLANKTA